MDYVEDDEWTLADLATRLHLERGELVFDADYVRGRMMKTRIVIGSNGRFTIETRNRHEMALRWLDRLRARSTSASSPNGPAPRRRREPATGSSR